MRLLSSLNLMLILVHAQKYCGKDCSKILRCADLWFRGVVFSTTA